MAATNISFDYSQSIVPLLADPKENAYLMDYFSNPRIVFLKGNHYYFLHAPGTPAPTVDEQLMMLVRDPIFIFGQDFRLKTPKEMGDTKVQAKTFKVKQIENDYVYYDDEEKFDDC